MTSAVLDAAHAFGCSPHGCMSGGFGRAEAFSVHLLLPHAERLVERVLSLPDGTAVTLDDVRRVCGVVVEHAREVRPRLGQLSA